jgi:hypothetical protein
MDLDLDEPGAQTASGTESSATTSEFVAYPRRHGFVMLDHTICRSKNMTLEAKGMLALLLGLPPGWRITAEGIAAQFCSDREGRKRILRILHELEEQHHLRRIKWQDANGRWNTRNEVYEDPNDNPNMPKSELDQSSRPKSSEGTSVDELAQLLPKSRLGTPGSRATPESLHGTPVHGTSASGQSIEDPERKSIPLPHAELTQGQPPRQGDKPPAPPNHRRVNQRALGVNPRALAKRADDAEAEQAALHRAKEFGRRRSLDCPIPPSEFEAELCQHWRGDNRQQELRAAAMGSFIANLPQQPSHPDSETSTPPPSRPTPAVLAHNRAQFDTTPADEQDGTVAAAGSPIEVIQSGAWREYSVDEQVRLLAAHRRQLDAAREPRDVHDLATMNGPFAESAGPETVDVASRTSPVPDRSDIDTTRPPGLTPDPQADHHRATINSIIETERSRGRSFDAIADRLQQAGFYGPVVAKAMLKARSNPAVSPSRSLASTPSYSP